MALLLLILPFAGALVGFALPTDRHRPAVLVAIAGAHLLLSGSILAGGVAAPDGRWLWLDPPGRIVLGLVSVLFFGCAIYAYGYLHLRGERPNRTFVACVMSLTGSLTVAIFARQIGLMWVAVEASALSAAPLIYFNHNARSIEATWKYLMVGSVGVAIALLGTFFLAYAAVRGGSEPSLAYDDLARVAPTLSAPWLKASFVLLLVGYGTKMGLAPMHTWKPDAYGEAPGLAGALFAGGVTSVAFLAVLRALHIAYAAGLGEFATRLLLVLGLLSMAVAGAFMVGQNDFKRMLAYSSVEHTGILAIGMGIGGLGAFGAMLHLLCNGLTKGVLFLSAANLHRAYGSKIAGEVTGALRGAPFSGTMFLLGFFAVTGAPPFGPFLSELTIARAAFGSGHGGTGALFLLFLMLVFVGMGATVLKVTLGQGDPPSTRWRERVTTSLPILGFMLLVLALGVYIPSGLQALLWDAVHWIEGTS
ncbi:MAG: proton-conducting transporter membrane subunit [Longimicrobiales bacterium]|nr:proton-conducting transporter membrane subunit [Longimicrobiales bacterium]